MHRDDEQIGLVQRCTPQGGSGLAVRCGSINPKLVRCEAPPLPWRGYWHSDFMFVRSEQWVGRYGTDGNPGHRQYWNNCRLLTYFDEYRDVPESPVVRCIPGTTREQVLDYLDNGTNEFVEVCGDALGTQRRFETSQGGWYPAICWREVNGDTIGRASYEVWGSRYFQRVANPDGEQYQAHADGCRPCDDLGDFDGIPIIDGGHRAPREVLSLDDPVPTNDERLLGAPVMAASLEVFVPGTYIDGPDMRDNAPRELIVADLQWTQYVAFRMEGAIWPGRASAGCSSKFYHYYHGGATVGSFQQQLAYYGYETSGNRVQLMGEAIPANYGGALAVHDTSTGDVCYDSFNSEEGADSFNEETDYNPSGYGDSVKVRLWDPYNP